MESFPCKDITQPFDKIIAVSVVPENLLPLNASANYLGSLPLGRWRNDDFMPPDL
jgi:hypothetical protein